MKRKNKFLDSIMDITLFRGKKAKYGPVHTMDIKLDHIRAVFFPRNFWEKYHYLGYVPYDDNMTMLHGLVFALDGYARPWWCPRWFLRLLHLFGSDNSLVRVRNRRLHNLERKLLKGILIWDIKTKWSYYDLRISISAPKFLQEMSDAIEYYTYKEGHKKELIEEIKKYEPDFCEYRTYCDIINYRNNLIEKNENLG